ncbi:hypothetical protein ACFQ5N_08435 [Lutibacter holmesii]|uniref:TonB C-terminal domain-containing protein n=1 Tax=Lutibacter holmesii TaxID=1137985 RepID=A0ABW3WNQ3_9FLAO
MKKNILIILGLFTLSVSSYSQKNEIKETSIEVEKDTTVYGLENNQAITAPVFKYKEKKGKLGVTEFLKDTLRHPEIDCEGKIYISFIIEKDSHISNVEILKDIGGVCIDYTKEALRIIDLMNGLWQPASINNKLVRYKTIIPISFNRE